MTEKKSLAILGGDERQIAMARLLAERGNKVAVVGLGEVEERIRPANVCRNWHDAIESAEAVILPLPVSSDGVRIHMPLHPEEVQLRLSAVLDRCHGKRILGGRIPDVVRRMADAREIVWTDYYESEVLQLKNALPTAEGAISIVMRELPVTVDGLSVAVIGYGRIGSLLAERLRALGAEVKVFARRAEQLALAELAHHGACRLALAGAEVFPEGALRGFRVILNTVPQPILTGRVLQEVDSNALLVELASVPGGFDLKAVEELGLRHIWAGSLPGKYAPESAGRILAETLELLLSD